MSPIAKVVAPSRISPHKGGNEGKNRLCNLDNNGRRIEDTDHRWPAFGIADSADAEANERRGGATRENLASGAAAPVTRLAYR